MSKASLLFQRTGMPPLPFVRGGCFLLNDKDLLQRLRCSLTDAIYVKRCVCVCVPVDKCLITWESGTAVPSEAVSQ